MIKSDDSTELNNPTSSQPHFDEFLKRLQRARTRTLSATLAKRIKPEDYVTVIDFFTSKTTPGTKRHQMLELVRNLQPGAGLRINKRDAQNKSMPIRTLTVLRTQEGEFQLIIEAKNKLAQETLEGVPQKITSNNKSFKAAFRIDSANEIEMLNVTVKLSKLENIKKEQLEAITKASHVHAFKTGPLYDNNLKKSLYLVKGSDSAPPSSSFNQKKFIEQLLAELANMADKNTTATSATSATSSDFLQFWERLEQAKIHLSTAVPEELKKLVSISDIEIILKFILTDLTDDAKKKILSLKPNQSIRLDKNETHLPRTLTLLRTHTGEYQLYIETKSKLAQKSADNTFAKQTLPHLAGKVKKGKPAWRIDAKKPIEMLNLRISLSHGEKEREDEITEIANEVKITQEMAAKTPRICNAELGSIYKKKGKHTQKDVYQISTYVEKASLDLFDLLMTEKLTSEDCQQLKLDILMAVKTLHDNDVIHQDINVNNIVVAKDASGKYRAQLIDLGQAHSQQFPRILLTSTICYSPEIDLMSTLPGYEKFYNHLHQQRCLANDYLAQGRPKDYIQPHKANDMWALGIIFYAIDHRRYPSKTDMLLADRLTLHLLDPNRNARFTIDQALDYLKEQTAKKTVIKPAITPIFTAKQPKLPVVTSDTVRDHNKSAAKGACK